MKYDLIIVGAGAAGLYGAYLLGEIGLRVLVVEARQRIGGRIFTIPSGTGADPVELGAEFIHGRPARTWALLRQAGISAYDVHDRHLQLRGRKLVENPGFWPEIQKVMSRLPRQGEDLSFTEFLKRESSFSPGQRRRARMFVEGFDAADPTDASARALAEAEEASAQIEGDRLFRPAGGYGPLMQWMQMQAARRQVEIRLGCAVREIKWGPGGCRVLVQNGQRPVTFSADRVLITLPLGVLQSGAVRFVPTVPGLAQAAAAMKMGSVAKMIFEFNEPVWEKIPGLDPLGFMHGAQLAVPTWWTQLPMRDTLLTGWAGGPAARRLAECGERSIARQAMDSLSRLLKISPDRLRRLIRSWHVFDWASDPFARGAYSYICVNGLEAAGGFRRIGREILFFAGEHTQPGFAGTVAAALDSANEAARRMGVRQGNSPMAWRSGTKVPPLDAP